MRTGALNGVLIWGNLDVNGREWADANKCRCSATGDFERSDEANKRRAPDDESLEKKV
jgi:hypothetical protein